MSFAVGRIKMPTIGSAPPLTPLLTSAPHVALAKPKTLTNSRTQTHGYGYPTKLVKSQILKIWCNACMQLLINA